MLCASCDAARFPETVSKVSTKSVASKKRTAVTKGTDSDRNKPSRSSQSDDEIECVKCTETVTSEMKTVSCDVCIEMSTAKNVPGCLEMYSMC